MARTAIESSLNRPGRLVLTVFHELGSLPAPQNAQLALVAVRAIEPGSENPGAAGIRLQVIAAGGERTTCYIDVDEVEAVAQGLDYMVRTLAQTHGFRGDVAEMTISTRGGFSVGFSLMDRKAYPFVRLDGVQTAVAAEALRRIGALIQYGQDHLRNTPAVTLG